MHKGEYMLYRKVDFNLPFIDLSKGICGVYKVTIDDLYFYIGSSTNLINRITAWKGIIAGAGGVSNKNVRKISNSCSRAKIEIIEYCDNNEVREREETYIKENWGNKYFLNRSKITVGSSFEMTKEEKDQLSRSLTIGAPAIKPISLRKTQGEWDVIKEKISSAGKRDLAAYILCEIRKIKDKFDGCPRCITKGSGGKKIQKRPYLPVASLEELNDICKLMNLPVSKVIDVLIISPLLVPEI